MTTDALEAWKVDAAAFPRSGTAAERARFAVAYAVLAPSSHNTQPWKFAVTEGELLLIADRSRSLPVIDPFDRELVISCGAALFNLRVAFAHFGVPVEITTFPRSAEPDILARITFPRSGAVLGEVGALFPAMAIRVTNRHPFAEEELPKGFLDTLRSAATSEGIELKLLHAMADRQRLAALIAEADRRQFADAYFRQELASWIHPSRSRDGMPVESQGMGSLSDAAVPVVAMAIRTFDVGGGVAASHEQLARGSPLLAVFATEVEDSEAWLITGQALERVLLVTAQAGLSASYLNQPVEIPELRQRLARDAATARHPQLLLRIGRGPAVPHAPRRALQDVLL